MPAIETDAAPAQGDAGDDVAANPRRASILLIVAASVGAALAHLGAVAMPYQIGAVMDGFGLSPVAAGAFGFVQMGSLALSMIVFGQFIDRIPPALAAVTGALLAALGNAAIFWLTLGPLPAYFAAALVGAGYGAVFSATISGVSASSNADRIYAVSSGGSVLIVVALMGLFPRFIEHFGPLGVFLGICGLLLVTAPVLLGFSWRPPTRHFEIQASPVLSREALAVYCLWTGFSLGSGVAWSFAERMAQALTNDAELIGTVLAATTFVGVAGTAVAAILPRQVPRAISAGVGLIGTGLGLLLFSTASSFWVFAVGSLMFWVSSMSFYCIMLGTTAALDPSGRIGTSGGGFDRFAFACGAPLGGFILGQSNYAWLGIAAILLCVVPGLFALPIIGRALRANR